MIYFSNVNGDWWALSADQPLYILDTDLLNQDQIAEIEEEWDGFENDKFEDVIQEYATNVIRLNSIVEE